MILEGLAVVWIGGGDTVVVFDVFEVDHSRPWSCLHYVNFSVTRVGYLDLFAGKTFSPLVLFAS